MSATLRAHDLLVQALRIRIATLTKRKFGASSEKIEREIEQLELPQESLQAVDPSAEDEDNSETDAQATEASQPGQSAAAPSCPKMLPANAAHLTPAKPARIVMPEACLQHDGDLRLLGKDVSDLIDMIAVQLKVIPCPAGSCKA